MESDHLPKCPAQHMQFVNLQNSHFFNVQHALLQKPLVSSCFIKEWILFHASCFGALSLLWYCVCNENVCEDALSKLARIEVFLPLSKPYVVCMSSDCFFKSESSDVHQSFLKPGLFRGNAASAVWYTRSNNHILAVWSNDTTHYCSGSYWNKHAVTDHLDSLPSHPPPRMGVQCMKRYH